MKAHNLIKLKNLDDVLASIEGCDWAKECIKKVPLVVVRRALLIDGKIPVGIRGENRNQRYPIYLERSNVLEVITPEMIVEKKLWKSNEHIKRSNIFEGLEVVDKILKEMNIKWGPTGSTAFELVSNIPTINKNSDLDIIIRSFEILDLDIAKELMRKFDEVPCKMDIQIEVPDGIISLEEYSRGNSPILLRKIDGPVLVNNPWSIQ